MESIPLFSVLIASYNNGRFIYEAVESVYKQSYSNWEIIIVDDCSTDDSVEIISKFIQSDNRIKLYRNDKNYGCGYTKRRCVEVSDGVICGFLDPDDGLEESALQISINAHKENPAVALVYSNTFICDSNLKVVSVKELKKIPSVKTLLESTSEDDMSVFHFASFKKSFYNKTLGIDPICLRAVDQDLYYKLEEVGGLLHINDRLYKYRVHGGGLSLGSSSTKAIAWHFYVIMETCKRRGLKFEEIIPGLITREIVNPLKQRKEFRWGSIILKPFRFIKKSIFQK